MNWKEFRNVIYYQDGSLRDIFIRETSLEDWRKWADYVTANYNVEFTIHEEKFTTNKIDFNIVVDFWNGKLNSPISATIYVGDILIKAYFFVEQEIDNDITPVEVKSLSDHNKLIEYLSGLSKALNKKVVVTPENEPETALILVNEEKVIYFPNVG